ncbi:MAG: octanoyltransferase [Oligoflexia bacterium]|nr:octanoyltransferase [Oligoflexia bacterium]
MARAPEPQFFRHDPARPWTYARLDALQRDLARRVREGGEGALLLSEVAPVITLGRRAGPGEVLLSPERLEALGISVYPTDRGGLATYHGPGQWVLFAVDSLERLTGDRRGVRQAVEGLLESALELAREFEPRAEIRSGMETGVWSPRGKLGAVGLHVEQEVVLHGLSLNGFRTPTSFVGLRPCGLDAPVDFLLSGPEGFEALGKALVAKVLKRFWK